MSLSFQMVKTLKGNSLLKPMALPINSIRNQGHNLSEICADLMLPRCGKEALAKSDCAKKKKHQKEHKTVSPFAHLFAHPECCGDPCPDVYPRFDDLYYKPSDKLTRVYTQTWVECPKKRIVKKPVCDYGKFIYPEYEKRPRKRSAMAANVCKVSEIDYLGLMKCSQVVLKGPCPKVMMPGCKAPRDPPKCKKNRLPSICRKICCPYPSFSECLKPKPKPKSPVECSCLDPISMCDVWAEVKRRDALEAARLKK